MFPVALTVAVKSPYASVALRCAAPVFAFGALHAASAVSAASETATMLTFD